MGKMARKRRKLRRTKLRREGRKPGDTKQLFCVGCSAHMKVRLTTGKEIYPHRRDLAKLFFWICDECGNYVGCHYGRMARHLGCIPTPSLREIRKEIHAALDPLWRSGPWSRDRLYKEMSRRMGFKYHTGQLRSLEQAGEALRHVEELIQQTEGVY